MAGSLFPGRLYGRFQFLYDDFSIATCLADLGIDQKEDLKAAQPGSRICYERLQLQGTLNDFLARRVNFQTQHFADTLMMWMAVLLTSSGVGLAGYQIVAASRLDPGAAHESELSIERGQTAACGSEGVRR